MRLNSKQILIQSAGDKHNHAIVSKYQSPWNFYPVSCAVITWIGGRAGKSKYDLTDKEYWRWAACHQVTDKDKIKKMKPILKPKTETDSIVHTSMSVMIDEVGENSTRVSTFYPGSLGNIVMTKHTGLISLIEKNKTSLNKLTKYIEDPDFKYNILYDIAVNSNTKEFIAAIEKDERWEKVHEFLNLNSMHKNVIYLHRKVKPNSKKEKEENAE